MPKGREQKELHWRIRWSNAQRLWYSIVKFNRKGRMHIQRKKSVALGETQQHKNTAAGIKLPVDPAANI